MNLEVYEGTLPYVYLLFASKDRHNVLPVINKLNNLGYRLWFDNGMNSDEDEHRAEKAFLMLFFLTEHSGDDEKLVDLIFASQSHNTPIILIYMDDTKLTGELDLLLSTRDHISRQDHENFGDFINAICALYEIEDCHNAKAVEEKPLVNKKWRCKECGYLYEGPEPPLSCPVCKAPSDDFVEVTAE